MQPFKVIPLTRGQFTIVDTEDYEKLSKFKWQALRQRKEPKYYATRAGGFRMHRIILQAKKGQCVDHINNNSLDNRKANLRIASYSQNGANRRSNRNSSSQFKGVTWYKQISKWMAQIVVNQKHYHLGYFADEKAAALAYNEAATKHFGAYAYLNPLK